MRRPLPYSTIGIAGALRHPCVCVPLLMVRVAYRPSFPAIGQARCLVIGGSGGTD
jgi:hypothetical protein